MKMCRSEFDKVRPGETLETAFEGKLKIIQPQKGYRFSIDAVLLAGLTRTRSQDRVLDLGTGCGIIPLLLAFRKSVTHITGVEIQESLAGIARRNVLLNKLDQQIKILQVDLRNVGSAMLDGPVDLVMSNPPYGILGNGRLSPASEKAIARHELFGGLAEVVAAAAKLLRWKGRLALIYPARRLPGLIKEISLGGFVPRRLTLIHPTLSSEAKLIHLESTKKGRGEDIEVRKPFIIYRGDGTYTDEMNTMYRNGPSVV